MPNLLKTTYVNISNKDKRVIDMNALMEAKLEKMRREQQEAAQASFVAGLNAEVIGDEEYLGEDGTEGLFEDQDAADGEAAADQEGEVKRQKPVKRTPAEISALVAKANEEAAEIIARAQEDANQIIDEAKADAESMRQSVYEEADGRGYAEGSARAAMELENAKNELNEKAAQLEQQYQELFDSMETELVDTITDVYQYIFNVDLSGQRQILLHLIEGAMRRIEGTRSFLVHVSSEDAAYVNMQKKTLEAATTLADSSVEIIEDISLSKNQCFIETDGGIFDCSLDTELSELTTKLRLLSYEKQDND